MSGRAWIGWPVVRQLTGAGKLGRGAATRSRATDQIAPRIRNPDRVAKSVCPYCAVGCGQNVYVRRAGAAGKERVIQIEGDPDSPVSRGRLCPKGSASLQLTTGDARQYRVKYRRPYGTDWEDLDLGTAMDMIADRIEARKKGWHAGVAAASAITGLQPLIGRAATVAAAVTGPGVAAYTSALLADTAVPAWHEAHRELPYLFVSSAATAAGGLALALVPPREAAPARNLALTGAGAELIAKGLLLRRLGPAAEPYQCGRAGRLMEAAEILTAAGLTAAALGTRNRLVAAAAGTALVASSACTRFGIFYAGRESARDPRYTIAPQKERLSRKAENNHYPERSRAVS